LEGLRLPCTQSDAGLDEKSFGKGHDAVSVLHDLEGRRVLEVVPERTREAANTLWTTILKPHKRLGSASSGQGYLGGALLGGHPEWRLRKP
jgi:hypothetical protein